MDSLAFAEFTKSVNKEDGNKALPMSRAEFKKYFDSSLKKAGIHFTPGNYKSKEQYDSVLNSGKKKHNWWQRQLIYKEIEVNEKYKNTTPGSVRLPAPPRGVHDTGLYTVATTAAGVTVIAPACR